MPTGTTLFQGTSGQPQSPRGTVPPPNQPPSVFLHGTYGSPGDLAIVAPLFTLNPTAIVVTGPDALFDQAFHLGNSPDVVAARVDATAHFHSDGWREGRKPSALFDTMFYLSQDPDVTAAGINPLTHHEQYAWHEGRDPSAGFSTTASLAANSDVAAAGVDPPPFAAIGHYGTGEGRAAVPATTHARPSISASTCTRTRRRSADPGHLPRPAARCPHKSRPARRPSSRQRSAITTAAGPNF